MKPQNPPVEPADRPEDAAESELTEAEAAALAMKSGHQAFAGSATGVGSVGFDEPGAFGVGAKVEKGPAKGPPKG